MAEGKVLRSHIDNLTKVFDQQDACDVFFIIEEKNLGAHKVFLKAGSQVLYEIASGWTDTMEPIPITDMKYDSFRALLRYFYSGEISITDENAFIYLSAATQFKMKYLEELCEEHITKSIGTDNVCAFMEEAINFKSVAIQKKCLEIFSKQTGEVMDTDFFKQISQPSLSAFLDVEETNDLEIGIFIRIKWWMEQKCEEKQLAVDGANMRRVIGNALYKIRFPTMTNQDFANSVTTIKGLLTESEMAKVFQKISVFDNGDIDCPFSSKFRCKNCNYYVPFSDLLKLCDAQVLYDIKNQQCNLETLLQNVKDTADDEQLNMTSCRIVMQCCADLANSVWVESHARSHNRDIRNELHCDFKNWKEVSKSQNVQDIMTKYMEMRKKLDKLVRWSFV